MGERKGGVEKKVKLENESKTGKARSVQKVFRCRLKETKKIKEKIEDAY